MPATSENSSPIIAGAYLRVSQDPSQGGRSVSGQWSDAQRVASSFGWQLETQYEDTGSASVFGRKRGVKRGDWTQLLKDVRSGVVQAIILAELSRGTRDLAGYAELAEIAAEAGCLIAAGGRLFDLRDESDSMLAALNIVFADNESRRISKRVQRGVRASVSEGRPPAGGAPFGYLRPPREAGVKTTQVPHPRHAYVVRASARYVLLGGTLSRVARYWRAVDPPRKWGAPRSVRH